MQKVVIFGKSQVESIDHQTNHKFTCHSCARLTKQIASLNIKIKINEQEIQKIMDSCQSQIVQKIRKELLDIHSKYEVLYKKISIIQKQNDDLFKQNTRLQNLLYKNQKSLKDDYYRTNYTQCSQNQTIQFVKQNKQNTRSSLDKEKYLNKNVNLSYSCDSDQSKEIMRLKNLIMNRQKVQKQRHQILLLFS